MGDYNHAGAVFRRSGITLNSLKLERYSLNMRLLLAMQNHNIEAQEALEREIAENTEQINLLSYDDSGR